MSVCPKIALTFVALSALALATPHVQADQSSRCEELNQQIQATVPDYQAMADLIIHRSESIAQCVTQIDQTLWPKLIATCLAGPTLFPSNPTKGVDLWLACIPWADFD
mgnify:CR=1 FL=1